MSGGRPRKLPPADIGEKITKLAAQGMTLMQIAQHLRVSRYAIQTWLKDPDIREFYDQGRADAIATVSNVLWKKAVEQEDLGAVLFWLKCQAGWSTKPKEEEPAKVILMIDPQGKTVDVAADPQLTMLKALDQDIQHLMHQKADRS